MSFRLAGVARSIPPSDSIRLKVRALTLLCLEKSSKDQPKAARAILICSEFIIDTQLIVSYFRTYGLFKHINMASATKPPRGGLCAKHHTRILRRRAAVCRLVCTEKLCPLPPDGRAPRRLRLRRRRRDSLLLAPPPPRRSPPPQQPPRPRRPRTGGGVPPHPPPRPTRGTDPTPPGLRN